MWTNTLAGLCLFIVAVATPVVVTGASATDELNRHHNHHIAEDTNRIIPNVYAVYVEPSVPCQETIGAALHADGCQVLFRTDVQTDLASMCSYEILSNSCELHHNNPSHHSRFLSGINGFIESFSVSNIELPFDDAAADVSSSFATEMLASTAGAYNPKAELLHKITGVLDARYKLGLTGKGVKIAIIDDGVYYKNPALGGGFGKGYKVAFGYDLVGDKYNGSSASIVPDSDPFDNCRDRPRGTFAAGVLAANATSITKPGFIPDFPFTGVAPGATLGAYRIFGCGNGTLTSADLVAAAIFRAANDGANIISFGFNAGLSTGLGRGVDAVAAQKVGKAGHIVVASIGDFGRAGAYVVGDGPGASQGTVTVTSFYDAQEALPTLLVDGTPHQYTGGDNRNFTLGVPYSGTFVVNTPNAVVKKVLDDGCNKINVNVTGKAVLIYYGSTDICGSAKRCNNAAAAGAAACFLYFDSDFISIGIKGGTIPSLLTTFSAAKAIIADLAANKRPVVIPTRNSTFALVPVGGTVSSFSSPGLTNDLYLKPDLGGVGGKLYSTSTPFSARVMGLNTPFGFASSTGVASTYVAGCLALLLEKRGTTIGFNAALAYLQNTATVTKIYNDTKIHSPAYQGAGLVNIYRAAITGTLVTPSALSLNDTTHRRRFETIQIQNNYPRSRGPVTYRLSHVPAATVNTFNGSDGFFLDDKTTTFTVASNSVATVRFKDNSSSTYTVTLKPGASVSIRLFIHEPRPSSADLWRTYGGYIAINNSLDSIVTHVPYAGVAGRWKDRPIWARNSTSLYTRWGLGDPSGPANLLFVKPKTVGTGLYTRTSFPPLARLDAVNASKYNFILAPLASTTRSANITITYLCSNVTALKKVGLARKTNFVAIVDLIDLFTKGKNVPYFAWRGGYPRNTFANYVGISSPRFYGFNGTVYTNDRLNATTKLPSGVYRMNFVALKNFGYTDNGDVDVIATPPFQLIYKTPLSKQDLAACKFDG